MEGVTQLGFAGIGATSQPDTILRRCLMPSRSDVPEHIRSDDKLSRRFRVTLGKALAARFNESDWAEFGTEHGIPLLEGNPRFYNSVRWGNEDLGRLVLQIVDYLYENHPELVVELFERKSVQGWFLLNAGDVLDAWSGGPDPVLVAISDGLERIDEVRHVIDLVEHRDRVARALPTDPALAVGATKDMLESAMRSILVERGHTDVEDLDFPGLTTHCFTELGLAPKTRPATDEERFLRKIYSSAKNMIEAANELRNVAGTGHGRDVSAPVHLQPIDASLVASAGLVLAAWLLRHQQHRS